MPFPLCITHSLLCRSKVWFWFSHSSYLLETQEHKTNISLNTICEHGLDFKELPVIELLFQISEVVNWFHLLRCMEVFDILVAILLFSESFSAAVGFYVSCLLISWWAWSMRRRPEATPILGRFIRTSSQKSQFSHSRHLIGRWKR